MTTGTEFTTHAQTLVEAITANITHVATVKNGCWRSVLLSEHNATVNKFAVFSDDVRSLEVDLGEYGVKVQSHLDDIELHLECAQEILDGVNNEHDTLCHAIYNYATALSHANALLFIVNAQRLEVVLKGKNVL